ncbi:MAG TPA: hypothetical protein VKK31_19640 [Thermoanaerobaculia bacterium]|nr:hypothetical protein [Thermoanaerobaculia bacterium]
MAFDLDILITGICAFVENKSSTKICVVMPSTDNYKSALDGEVLCPHEGYIEQNYAFGRTPLRWQRLSFDIKGGDNDYIKLPVASKNDLGLIDLKDSGVMKETNPDIVLDTPPETVLAQVCLDRGGVELTDGGVWTFDPKGVVVELKVAHEITIKLKQIESAEAILKPFNGGKPITIKINPARFPSAALRVVNTCKLSAKPGEGYLRRDRDFKWYYELLKDFSSSELYSADLQIPRYKTGALIGGNNCFPSRLERVDF